MINATTLAYLPLRPVPFSPYFRQYLKLVRKACPLEDKNIYNACAIRVFLFIVFKEKHDKVEKISKISKISII